MTPLGDKRGEPYDQAALNEASRKLHMFFLREGSSYGTWACEEIGRVFMTAYLKAAPSHGAAPSPVLGECEECGQTVMTPLKHLPQEERVAQLIAHRAVHNQEQDVANGKLAGYCLVCGVPWPCTYAGVPSTAAPINAASQKKTQPPLSDSERGQTGSAGPADAAPSSTAPTKDQERTRLYWLDMLAELRAERRREPHQGYKRRVIMFTVEDENDAGGEPVVTFSVEPEELDDIICLLAAASAIERPSPDAEVERLRGELEKAQELAKRIVAIKVRK